MLHWDVDCGNAVYTWETNHYPTKQEVMDYMHDMDKDFYQGIYEEEHYNNETNLTYQEWFDANYNHADENYIGIRNDSFHEYISTQEIN